jgi:hypothetical protein
MAMSQSSLATKIQAEIINQFGAPADASTLQKFANAIAKAVVDEIQQNATVTASGPDPQGGTQNVTGTVS